MTAIETLRGRLTLSYVAMLAVALLVVGGLTYVLLARALFARIDDDLRAATEVTITSLSNDLDEGQDVQDAARATAAELSSTQQVLAIYDGGGRLLSEKRRADEPSIALPALETIPTDDPMLRTLQPVAGSTDRYRVAIRRTTIVPQQVPYVIAIASPLEPIDDQLLFLRNILAAVVPLTLLAAGIGGWLLVRRGLAPVGAMAAEARRIGVEDVSRRLPVANPRDEIGQLGQTVNDVLARLDAALVQQRQFMADASHELRTPVATTRTAAGVALQLPHRDEQEYRQTLEIIERQMTRLSRIVDDMFTLARADAGRYPVHRTPMYLDEVVGEVVSSARILAETRGVAIDVDVTGPAPFTGDEDLVRRLLVNLIDNAVRHSPGETTVRVALQAAEGGYALTVMDRGPGVRAADRTKIFERFYRADAARSRRSGEHGGAGLGLPLARWIARQHGGDVTLVDGSPGNTTFVAFLASHG